ncbi:VOC family protein [Pontibacter kalidii]
MTFELGGQYFMRLNIGPRFTPNPSFSCYVVCETASELEYLVSL